MRPSTAPDRRPAARRDTGARRRRLAAVAAGALLVALTGLLASVPATAGPGRPVTGPTHGEGDYIVQLNAPDLVIAIFCIKSETTMKKPRGSERQCSGRKGATDSDFALRIPYTPGDRIWIDIEVIGQNTKDDIEITNASSCSLSGSAFSVKFECDTPVGGVRTFSEPALQPYAGATTNPDGPLMQVLNVLAWCVSAACVAGLLITGLNLALQLRRGEPGEFSEHWRGTVIVGVACILGMTAGPLVESLNLFA